MRSELHVFGHPGCKPCDALKRELRKYNIKYIYHDIYTDEGEEALGKLEAFAASVPIIVLVVQGKPYEQWNGYSKKIVNKIREAYESIKRR